MTRPGCGKKTKKGKYRKHTPITSKAQQGKFGSELARRRVGKARQMKSIKTKELESHLKESKGKNLPAKAGTPEGYKAGLSGQKIRSKGKGRGLGRGKGKGPIGVPAGISEAGSYVKERRKLRNRRAG